jgi:hypothetical protein
MIHNVLSFGNIPTFPLKEHCLKTAPNYTRIDYLHKIKISHTIVNQ